MGGAGAAISGGNFWQGAGIGLVVSALNHSFHQEDPPKKKSNWKLINKNSNGSTSDFTTAETFNNENSFKYLKNNISSLNGMSSNLTLVSDWTTSVTGSKAIYDIIKGIGKLNPITLGIGGVASGNNVLIQDRIEYYNTVRDNYNTLHSKSGVSGSGIEFRHRVFSAPYGSHYDVYQAYDVKTGNSLGRLKQ